MEHLIDLKPITEPPIGQPATTEHCSVQSQDGSNGEARVLGAALDPSRRVREHGGRVHLRPSAGRGRQTHHGRERLSREARWLREERLPEAESSHLTGRLKKVPYFFTNSSFLQIINMNSKYRVTQQVAHNTQPPWIGTVQENANDRLQAFQMSHNTGSPCRVGTGYCACWTWSDCHNIRYPF